ncbi:MAG: GntR family transcriptional regulator [Eubacteriales bacterium]|nr:GntR family transcriptional regulator [Eubacteriales bacterium]
MQDHLAPNEEQYLPLRESVFNTLRKAILTGELKPGERLMEIHLANRLGVSRTPIREAIRKLELEGLVKIIPRSGAQVAQISEKELKDVLEVRRSLDVLCAVLASQRITPEEKVRLKQACASFEKVTKTGDQVEIARADVEFHDIISEATKNRRLIQILGNLADQIYRYRFEYIKDDLRYEQLVREHYAICRAIVEGDESAASQSAKIHIDHQEESILRQLHLTKQAGFFRKEVSLHGKE